MKYLPYAFASLVMVVGLSIAGINLSKSDVSDWSTTAADNDDADSAIDFAENQTPASLNNSSRALMQQIRQWAEQTESQNLYAGTTGNIATNAISITPTVVPSSLTKGAMYFFQSPTTNTGAVTLQVASQTTASILKENDTALAAGDIENNQIVMVVYDGNNFQMINPSAASSTVDITLDTAPVLGADLGLGGFNIDFPTTANVDDVIDDDAMTTADATNLATAESIKAYVDAQVAAQGVVQRAYAEDGAVATGTTVMVDDDTIPQNTEGDQYMTLAITPTSATNRLRIRFVGSFAHNTTENHLIAALFQDSTADALKAAYAHSNGAAANIPAQIVVEHEMVAGTTSATTFKIRAGHDGAGTTTFNGSAGSRLLGGVMTGTMVIEEIVP